MIEEFIDGVSYVQTWFYERNGSAWLHAAPDFAFWGPAKETTHESVIVRYQAVDEVFAQQISKFAQLMAKSWAAKSSAAQTGKRSRSILSPNQRTASPGGQEAKTFCRFCRRTSVARAPICLSTIICAFKLRHNWQITLSMMQRAACPLRIHMTPYICVNRWLIISWRGSPSLIKAPTW